MLPTFLLLLDLMMLLTLSVVFHKGGSDLKRRKRSYGALPFPSMSAKSLWKPPAPALLVRRVISVAGILQHQFLKIDSL
jgi:hypothetical protein